MPRLPLFDILPAAEVAWLKRVLIRDSLIQGAVISSAGELATALWLLAGAITVRRAINRGGGIHEIGLDPPDGLACPFALMGTGRIAWRTDVWQGGSAWRLDRSNFAALRDKAPTLRIKAEAAAEVETGQLTEELMLLPRRNAPAALAARLADYFQAVGEAAIRTTHRELAALVGLRRETVTLALQELEGARAIRNRRGQIELLDLDQLQSLAGKRNR